MSEVDVIDIKYGIRQIVGGELKNLPADYSLLVIVKLKNYEKVITSFMDCFLNEKKYRGTYITTNKPFGKLQSDFSKKGIKVDRLFFIDCTSGGALMKKIGGTNVFSSQNVTQINVLLDKARKQGKLGKFIFLDSISALLIYNDEKAVEKFVHTLLGRIYKWKVAGVFITVETNANKDVIDNLSLFFDKVIRLGML